MILSTVELENEMSCSFKTVQYSDDTNESPVLTLLPWFSIILSPVNSKISFEKKSDKKW